MKRIAGLIVAVSLTLGSSAAVTARDGAPEEKQVIVQMISGDGEILAVGLIVISPGDDSRPLAELVEKQVGRQWWGLSRGVVYRFSERTQTWEAIMTRDIGETETVVGTMSAGLRLSELRSGDVIRLSGNVVF